MLALCNAKKVMLLQRQHQFLFKEYFFKVKRSYFSSVVFTGLNSSIPVTLVMEFGSNTQRRLVKRKIQSMCSQKYRVYSPPNCYLTDMETCLYIFQTEIKKQCICFIIPNSTALKKIHLKTQFVVNFNTHSQISDSY